MRWSGEQSPGFVFVTRIIGFITFLIFVVLANILNNIDPDRFGAVVRFLNDNLPLLFIIAIVMIIADVLSAFPFPLDLPVPIIRAFGSVFIIAFFLALVQWLHISAELYNMFLILSYLIVPLVFVIVLVAGYYRIFRRLFIGGKTNGAAPAVTDPTIGTPAPTVQANGTKSWDDVVAELRLMLWELFHRLREEIAGRR